MLLLDYKIGKLQFSKERNVISVIYYKIIVLYVYFVLLFFFNKLHLTRVMKSVMFKGNKLEKRERKPKNHFDGMNFSL